MHTSLIRLQEAEYGERDLEPAVEAIKKGSLVAFPTETVYGLGGNALDSTVVDKIYEAKGRPSDNPLILHIASWEGLAPLVSEVPKAAEELAKAFWPGPLTLVLRKSAVVPYEATGGRDTVAVRMPNHRVALDLIRLSGVPIAAPSANASGRPSPTMAKHVMEDLDGRVEVVLDGGRVGIGIESTILDVTGEAPVILRPGYVTQAMMEGIVGSIGWDKSGEAKAPGMKYRHYAPKGELFVLEGAKEDVVREINRRAGKKAYGEVGVIATEETKKEYRSSVVRSVGHRGDEEGIARELYKVLREFDEKGVTYIYTESFHSEGLGRAIMNRLAKAANGKIVTVKPSEAKNGRMEG